MYKDKWTHTYLAYGPKIYPKAHENPMTFSFIPSPIFLESLGHGSGDGSPPWKDCITTMPVSGGASSSSMKV